MEYLLQVRRRVLERLQATKGISAALSGQLDRAGYTRWLTNVYHYAQHSAVVIGLAGSRCVADHPELADYLFQHAREELGHEQWALADLAELGVPAETVRSSRPVPSCAAMIGYEYYVAGHANPVGLFGWLYVLEAMGEDLGGRMADLLNQELALSNRGLRFLAGHGKADRDHTADLTQQITKHITGDQDRSDVHHVADVVSDLYVRMFEEMAA